MSEKSLSNMAGQSNVWQSDANDPLFSIFYQEGHANGWVLFKFKVKSLDGVKLQSCFLVENHGKGARDRIEALSISNGGKVRHLINLPSVAYSLSFKPADRPCCFRLDEGTVRSIGGIELALRLSILLIKQRLFTGRSFLSVLKTGMRLIRQGRFTQIRQILTGAYSVSRKAGSYASWIKEVEPQLLTSLPVAATAALKKNPPLISVLISTYNTPVAFLRTAIESVIKQAYLHWELCIVDDASDQGSVHAIIQEYCKIDDRIKYFFREQNGHISAGLNTALGMASGEFMTVLDHDDCLAICALEWVACTIIEHPAVDYIYTDEDKISSEGIRFDPFFKPDWSPEYMLSLMYTCHMSVFRTSLVKNLGGYRSAFDGAQDYDLTLRVVAQTTRIIHIPHILYHWRAWSNSTAMSLASKPYAYGRQRRALTEFLQYKNESFEIQDHPIPVLHRVIFKPKHQSLISIVIPTANGKIDWKLGTQRHIDAIVESIREKTTYAAYEIIIVHNGDLTPEQIARFDCDSAISLVAYSDTNFSLSRKINIGVDAARGELIVLLNDDVRIISSDWLELMLGMAQRDGVGAVGAKLLFPNDTIQHAGVTVLEGSPGHPFYGDPRDAVGYWSALQVDRNYIAVTGACQMTPRALFRELGGYSEEFPLNYNDVEYCIRLYKKGYRMVSMANVLLYHYEGVSKDGGRGVADHEHAKFLKIWNEALDRDPYYSPNLSQTENFETPW
jgi:glycosyltransferase involved in cell wall biosynthesis